MNWVSSSGGVQPPFFGGVTVDDGLTVIDAVLPAGYAALIYEGKLAIFRDSGRPFVLAVGPFEWVLGQFNGYSDGPVFIVFVSLTPSTGIVTYNLIITSL